MSLLALDMTRAERESCARRLELLDAAVLALEALEPPSPTTPSAETVPQPDPPPLDPPRPAVKARATNTSRAKVTDEMLEAACQNLDFSKGVLPQLAARLGVPQGSIHAYAVKARQLGWLPPAGARTTLPTSPTDDPIVAKAKELHAAAVAKGHSDPIGFVVDNLNVSRSKAKELLGIPAGQR